MPADLAKKTAGRQGTLKIEWQGAGMDAEAFGQEGRGALPHTPRFTALVFQNDALCVRETGGLTRPSHHFANLWRRSGRSSALPYPPAQEKQGHYLPNAAPLQAVWCQAANPGRKTEDRGALPHTPRFTALVFQNDALRVHETGGPTRPLHHFANLWRCPGRSPALPKPTGQGKQR